ncbi:proline reductase-associated electron transfer protein PrdC [uncultured Clostridium sp.]|uniref:proline reductase-associated electron transfer protein PrdC n=1 Tax=uncultured Clostridium sp. TaxID=59620 RepID=UPI0025EF30A9|nr:proline reductase-associated electron transfer protein PrdC [uncultured Clostridium sp.]
MKYIYEYPLKQHIGTRVAPVVVNGDSVNRGQLLAFQGENSLGANIYASVSGKVLEVSESSIIIEADEHQSKDYIHLKKSTPLELIKEAGIVGAGGAGFPTYAKFSKPFKENGTVVINAAECEPILSHNIGRIEKKPKQLLRGLEIAMEVANASNGVIAIKKKHHDAIKKLEEANTNSNIRIVTLEDIYPMGEERAVIREVFGKLLSVNSLPLEADAIVINAETSCRIQEAVDEKKPFIDKDITVGGKIAGNSSEKLIQVFYDVPLGMKVSRVFEMAGGVTKDYGELIMGGPFTGKRTTLDSSIVKTTGSLIASECFMKGPSKIGILVCACGADKERLCEIAESMGSKVAGVEYCKQAIEVKGSRKCENPGKCPGQVQKVMALKKAGAQAVLISNCTDCSNTVMSCAPKLGLPVYHCTDGALRAVNHKLIRKFSRN